MTHVGVQCYDFWFGHECMSCIRTASRAKLGMLNTMSKIRGQVKTTGYPQTEGLLGDCMLRYGLELGEESTFGNVRTYRQSSARMHRHEPQADGYGNPIAVRWNAARSRELYLSLNHTILHTVHCEMCFLQYCCTYSIWTQLWHLVVLYWCQTQMSTY